MDDTLVKKLNRDTQAPEITRLADYCRKLVRMSRTDMGPRWKIWDRNNDVYRGVRDPDEEDIEAREHNEPEKFVVPMIYAQVQTFAAFLFILFRQGPKFFEWRATGTEDHALRESIEELLDRDLRHNKWPTRLYQFLIDLARFSIAPMKITWVRETQWAPVVTEPSSGAQMGFNAVTLQELTKYEGNNVDSIDPYKFFPDTRKPLSLWYKGEFVADEEEVHRSVLRDWERQGLVTGTKFLSPMTETHFDNRGPTRLSKLKRMVEKGAGDEDDYPVCITNIQINLIPNDWGLGPEKHPSKHQVVLANDDRVLRVDKLGYLHDQWTYVVGQFSPDNQQSVNESLTDVPFAIQDVVSYLINTHLQSVRKSLENNLVYDSTAVDVGSLESRSPFIKVNKSAARLGVDKFVRQLQHTDTTGSFMNDASALMGIMQTVTGVNENMLGQFHGGRRSAREAAQTHAGASSRLKMVGEVVFHDALAPGAKQMLINQRQGMSFETFGKVLGTETENLDKLYAQFHPANPAELVGSEDYFPMDNSTEIEKGMLAATLQELMVAMIGNPLNATMMNFNFGALMKEILMLRGIENTDRFALDRGIRNGDPDAIRQLQSITAQANAPAA